MFFNRFCRSFRKLFENSMDSKESDNRSKCEDNPSLDEFKECVDYSSEELVDKDIEDMNEKTKAITDWSEIQEMETESYCSSSMRSSVMLKPLTAKNPLSKPKDFNRLLEKWGESVGIFDETTGAQNRLIRLSQLNNFFELKLSSLNCSDSVLLCSLINSRYPRFYTSTVNYYQRWRMRYNIFVVSDSLINTEEAPHRPICSSDSVLDIPSDQLVLHIGEIHLYFDVVPKYSQPIYVNSSFYSNKCHINVWPNVVVNPNVMNRISRIVNSIRYSKDIFQFKFPLNGSLFYRKNHLFDKFIERQNELIEETVKVFRKNEQKNRKFQNWSQKQMKYRQRIQTRDQFAYDYDSRHKTSEEYEFEKQNDFCYNIRNNKYFSRNEPKISSNRSVNQTIGGKTNGPDSGDNDCRMEWSDNRSDNNCPKK